jgi:hypothetical protein
MNWIACVPLGGAVLLTSCRNSDVPADRTSISQPSAVNQTPRAIPTPSQHWVQNNQLRALMNSISQQANALPAGVPEDPESSRVLARKQTFDQVAMLANGLSQTARQIPLDVKQSQLSEDDRRGFEAEAATLHDLAVELKSAAEARQVERMQSTLSSINSTCIACHSRYRDLTGVLGPRASLNFEQ